MLADLADELYVVFSFLPLDEYINLFSVCQQWSQISRNDSFWHYLYKSRFSCEIFDKIINLDACLTDKFHFKSILKRILCQKLIPKWKNELVTHLSSTSISYTHFERTYHLIHKLSDTQWLRRLLFNDCVYVKIINSFPTSLGQWNNIVVSMINLVYHRNQLYFRLWKDDLYFSIFKITNTELFAIFEPILISEFEHKIKNPAILLQHALSYSHIPLSIIIAIFEGRQSNLLRSHQGLLSIAVRYSSPTVLKYMIINGFEPKLQTDNVFLQLLGNTNATDQTLDKLKFLLTYTMDINVKDSMGQTPLIMACRMNLKNPVVGKMIDLLLNYGTKISDVDIHGKTALYYIQKYMLENQDQIGVASRIVSKLRGE
jgi:hypothetical protein